MRIHVRGDCAETQVPDQTATVAPTELVRPEATPTPLRWPEIASDEIGRSSRAPPRRGSDPPRVDRALAWHVMMRLEDDRVIAREARERRLVAGSLFARGKSCQLLAFHIVDSHIHVLLACSRQMAGRFARHSGSSIRRLLRLPVAFRTRIRPVLDQSHLYSTFRYILRQKERHQLVLDPFHDGNSLLELLGLRVLAPWSIINVRTTLPRIRSADLHEILGLDLSRAPLAFEALREAAAAAVGAPDLSHRGTAASSARVAAAQIARASGLAPRATASLLALDERSVRRLEARSADPAVARAVRLQLRLRGELTLR